MIKLITNCSLRILNEALLHIPTTEDYTVLKSLPIGFFRDTSKISIPLKYYYGEEKQRLKYLVETSGSFTLTLDRDLPEEILEVNSNPSLRWMIATSESNIALITSVVELTRTINYTSCPGQSYNFPIGTALEFYCWNRNMVCLNSFMNTLNIWGTLDTASFYKGMCYLNKNIDGELVGWFRNYSPFNKVGVFKSSDYFQTATEIKVLTIGYGDFSRWPTNYRLQIFPNPVKLPDGSLAGIIQFDVVGGQVLYYSYICDEELNFSFISTNYFDRSDCVINGVSGSMVTPSLGYIDGVLKLIFIHFRGRLGIDYGDTQDVYIADFDIETCSYSNLELIITSDEIPLVDSDVTYIGGQIGSVGIVNLQNETYITIAGTCKNYFNTTIAENLLIGVMYKSGSSWVLDPNGPTILTPKGDVQLNGTWGFNTHYGSVPVYYHDVDNNRLLLGNNIAVATNQYHNILTSIDLLKKY